ncbi:MAG: hypothetical protein JWM21_4261 [Acidobacteria bacterium]|nr:hypothetical protein [Acidobacteriota bacterium]
MPPHFFLSYARADSSPLVKKFFEDLCDTIRITAGLPRSEIVGFYEEIRSRPAWDARSSDALQTSRALVSLLSPAYFHDEQAGREWQIFEMRKSQPAALEGTLALGLAEVITPVSWMPWHGPVPRVISEMLANPDHIYQQRTVLTMLKASGQFLGEYAHFVKTLANQILEMAANATLPRLDSLPPAHEVSNPFHLWEGPATETSNEDDKRNRCRFDDNFIKTLAEHINLTSGRVPPEQASSSVDVTPARAFNEYNEPDILAVDNAPPDKLRVFIIDDDEQVNKLLAGSLPLADFDVEAFTEAEKASDKLYGDDRSRSAPDLFVVDLHLKGGKMQGLELIKKLTDQMVPSSIIAISGTEGDLEQAIKAGAVGIGKPPNYFKLVEKMRKLATFGRKRRLRKRGSVDSSRHYRPVFLSFSNDHRRLATGLKSQIESEAIGVWYSWDVMGRDEEAWQPHVISGIDHANIFLALITQGFLQSNNCLAELERFRRRRTGKPSDPLLLPVLYSSSGSSDALRNDERIKSILDGYKDDCLDLSGNGFLNGLQVIEGRIQKRIQQPRA